MSLLLIGYGNMGKAIAKQVLASKLLPPESFIIVDPNEHKREEAVFEFNCRAYESLHDQIFESVDTILIAVKPQSFQDLSVILKPHVKDSVLVISVMAGVTLATIAESLGGVTQVVRVMPNLPSTIGKGMSVVSAMSSVTKSRLEFAESLFRTVGEVLYVDNENNIDSATAVSGSGPGFILEIIKGYRAGAMKLGFSESQSDLLVKQTLLGTTELWDKSSLDTTELQNSVVSKGGTTEAGLKRLRESGVVEAFEEAVLAAYKRAKELGN